MTQNENNYTNIGDVEMTEEENLDEKMEMWYSFGLIINNLNGRK